MKTTQFKILPPVNFHIVSEAGYLELYYYLHILMYKIMNCALSAKVNESNSIV